MPNKTRRNFIKSSLNTAAVVSLGGVAGFSIIKSSKDNMVWQLDPEICAQCEKCATNCVLPQSAVKCVHSFSMCGYCDLCSGYLEPGAKSRDTGAENQLCPTGAIKRTFIERPYFEYIIDEDLCTGCADCVKGCTDFGNGSLHLQINQDLCVNCNQCSIAIACPSNAIERVALAEPYRPKSGYKAAEV